MDVKESDQIIESLLFASPDPLSQSLLNQVFDKPIPFLNETVKRLNEFYFKSANNFNGLVECIFERYCQAACHGGLSSIERKSGDHEKLP